MKSRLILDAKLREICPNVYFQPPESIKLKYPCIIYQLSDIDIHHADDRYYLAGKRYTVFGITKDPDSDIPDKLALLEMSAFDRTYTSDNLYHYVYTIYN